MIPIIFKPMYVITIICNIFSFFVSILLDRFAAYVDTGILVIVSTINGIMLMYPIVCAGSDGLYNPK